MSASRWRLAEQRRRVCAQDHLCRMNSAQISGQEENDLLRAAVEATSTSTQETLNFLTCLSRAQQVLPLAQAAMGVHLLSCFHALFFFFPRKPPKRAGDGPRQGSHRLGRSRGVMADSKRPHTFTEGAMSDARADDLARAAARSTAL